MAAIRCIFHCLAWAFFILFAANAGEPLVKEGPDGLIYAKTAGGDQIPDFSYCGYKGGGIALPDFKVVEALSPNESGDDTERIQKAIDKVAERPLLGNGERGAVLLKAGTYRVSGTLKLKASGVVLRGEGQNEDGTIIIATGTKKRALIDVRGGSAGDEIEGSRRAIAQNRIPVGARTITLESTDGLKVGDPIVVFQTRTNEWIQTLGMDKLNRGPKDAVKNWSAEAYSLRFERTILGLEGTTITVDAPIVCAIEKKWGGGVVYKTTPDERIFNVGVEDLRFISEYAKGKQGSDEKHAWDGVKVNQAKDSWVRNVTAQHFGYSCVNVSSRCKQITVQDCACIDPASRISGGRRYSFAMAGRLCLIQRCYTRLGRHDYVMHARVPGPNVFLDCIADNPRSDSGPHHRWATGTLYDNVICGALNVQNRGRSGTGHGWAGANMVFWNCKTRSISSHKPPTANNYVIGCTGKISAKGHVESSGKHVEPRSLYIRQLELRLGKKAVEAVTTSAQRDGTIEKVLRTTLQPKATSLYR